jgi:mannose-6-phosphate isomerase-like protein (cupin superfamily)
MEGLSHYQKEDRPWGNFERFTLNEASTVKIITVKPNEELSLQQHEHRDEKWRILQGGGRVVIGDTDTGVAPGDEFFVVRGTKHRVIAGPEGLLFLEIAFGNFDENDIIRFEDKYGRV